MFVATEGTRNVCRSDSYEAKKVEKENEKEKGREGKRKRNEHLLNAITFRDPNPMTNDYANILSYASCIQFLGVCPVLKSHEI